MTNLLQRFLHLHHFQFWHSGKEILFKKINSDWNSHGSLCHLNYSINHIKDVVDGAGGVVIFPQWQFWEKKQTKQLWKLPVTQFPQQSMC